LSLQLGKYQKYVVLAPEERYGKYYKFEGHVKKLIGWLNIDVGDVLCRKNVIFDIIERVEKRRVYFHVFHDIIMSEQNEISHYCFWILKLAPLVNKKNPDQHINARLAIFLFLNMLKKVGNARGRPVSFNKKFVQNLMYAFVYRDLSKEAIMAIADALLTGVG
jgi:hypothetical protein